MSSSMDDEPMDTVSEAREDRERDSGDSREPRDSRDARESRAVEKVGRSVYVGNLSWDTRWQGLKDHMREAGDVLHAEVFKDSAGRSAGCGIVEFENSADAENAIRVMNDTVLDGRAIFVREDREEGKSRSRAPPRERTYHSDYPRSSRSAPSSREGGREGRRKIVVWNLPYHMRWQQLKDIFRDSGDVIRADVPLHPDGKSKGMGTVLFERQEDAERAIEDWSGKTIEGRVVDVRWDKFE